MKTKYFIRNISTSVLGKLFTMVLALVVPKLIIETYGSEVNGVVASLMSFVIYLNLLEAGIGAASIQALYALVPHNKYDEINNVLSATEKFYRRNGYIYLISIMLLAFAYPLAVNSTLPYTQIFIMVVLLLAPNLMIYFIQGKYSVVLTAHNKIYIETIFISVTGILVNAARIILILNRFSIVMVLFVTGLFNVFSALSLVYYVKRNYDFIDFSVKPNFKAISKKNDLIAYRVLAIAMQNVDIILLTFFLNLKIVSVYALYNMVITQVRFIPNTLSHSISTSMGQLYYQDSEGFKKVYDCYETYYLAINFTLFVSVYIVIIPFIRIYTAHITDINYVDPLLAFLIILIPIYEGLRMPGTNLFFWTANYDRLKKYAIIEAFANVILSVILLHYYGVYGVLLASTIALTYFNIISSRFVYKELLHEDIIRLIRKSFVLIVSSFLVVKLMDVINLQSYNFLKFFINGAITFAITSFIFFVGISFVEYQSFKTLVEYAGRFILRRKAE